MSKPFTLVVGVDFGPAGVAALREAMALSASRAEEVVLHVVHVLTDVPTSARGEASIEKANTLLEAGPRTLRAFLDKESPNLPLTKLSTKVVLHTRIGGAAEAIHQLAVDVDADGIIVGTRGRGAAARFVLGSVSSQLVEIARCSVVIARTKDYEGLARSAAVEPVCPDCAKVRAESGGATQWCEYHSRPQVRAHTYSYSETYAFSGHDPGIVPT